jgi:hypothetical protein
MEQTNYASKGVAGTGLGLGIAGTALGLLQQNGGVSSILGNGTNAARVSELESQIAGLKAEKYADSAVGIERERRLALEEKTIGYTIDIEKRLSAIEATAPLKEQLINQKIDNVAQMAANGFANLQQVINGVKCQAKDWVDQEAERRCCADNKIVCYANGTFAAAGSVSPTYATTAEAKTFSNPLNCGCGCGC